MHKTVLVDLVMFEKLYFSRQKQNSCLQTAKQHDFKPVVKSHYNVQDRYIANYTGAILGTSPHT